MRDPWFGFDTEIDVLFGWQKGMRAAHQRWLWANTRIEPVALTLVVRRLTPESDKRRVGSVDVETFKT